MRALLAPYENRKLTLALIYEAADKITTLYRNKGYLVAKAYVPAQNARDGLLRLKLVAGQYGAVTVHNSSLVRDDYLKEVVDHALAGSPLIHKDEMERALLLISDLPGAGVPRIALAPGSKPRRRTSYSASPSRAASAAIFLPTILVPAGPGETD